jgi:hypothetical protein
MANASFYRIKYGTIDLMTNYWVGGHLLTWWQPLSSCLNKTSLLTLEFEQIIFMKVLGICLHFPTKKNELIWTSKTRDMGWILNSVWAARQIPTSLLLLQFELDNCHFESWTLMKVLGLCLSFPSIYTIPKSMFCSSIYDPITEWCFSLNWTNISFLSLALSLSSQFQYLNRSINSLNYEICLHSK